MRLPSPPSFPKAIWTARLAFLILAVHPGTSSVAEAKSATVPIKGSFLAVEIYDEQFPTLFVDGSGSGRATHLGRFTVTYESEVYIPTLAGSGSAYFIAANGDCLVTEVTGQANPTDDPDILYIVESFTIVGGTGRFDGASGEFTVVRLLNAITGVTKGRLRGTIIKQ